MNYQIELRHLLYFQALAEELHFRKAAERLFISQPALTRQIQQLEEIYQAKLFDRGQRHVHLTASGIYLKAEVDILVNQLRNMETQVQKISSGKLAELKLGFIGSAIQTILPEILLQLDQQYPLLDISLQELSNEKQLESLYNNELDFAFIRSENVPEHLALKKLLAEPFELVVPKDYPIQQGNFKSMADFQEERFILFSKQYSSAYYDLVMSIFTDQGYMPNVTLKTVNAFSIFHLVAQGMGVAIVPASLKKGYETNVNFISLTSLPQRTTLSLVWNKNNRNIGIPRLLEIVDEILAGRMLS